VRPSSAGDKGVHFPSRYTIATKKIELPWKQLVSRKVERTLENSGRMQHMA